MDISVIGLGKAGLPLAAIIADSGFNVTGIDLDSKKCELINSGENPIPEEPGLESLIKKYGGKSLRAFTDYCSASNCKAYIIIVPLFINEFREPDFRTLKGAVKSVGKMLKKGDLVVVETTVPPLTTEELVLRWLEEESGMHLGEFYLAHSPERIMSGNCISRLREFPKVIGGVDKKSGIVAFEMYRKFIPNLHLVSSARVAEFVKNIEGCYRDVNIALANELYKIAEELGIEFYESREHANHEYCHLLLPSTGVGGHCIPVYPWFLIKEMERKGKDEFADLLRKSREINDKMIEYWANKIVIACLKIDKPLNKITICIKGITYRKGVKELFHSRNMALAKLLADKGFRISIYDEMFTREEIEKLGLAWGDPDLADLTFDPFDLKIKLNAQKNV
ncbi:MAG: UDP-N-acetyl-D-mannosaminuronic acid dehydrogenase [Candidatus Methanosuratincola subterraneus]|uniref:UDP-N-acetyl-D-mannosamine dehydrogenase n=1 Tax=Methanosuratincola subterraneus TaxID=2593994 RepID=A0A444L7B3_METS7|nr:MAG: UDP-N-acetyl-D-mannosaminuronic acid dehydrogenase [Candidatus Methanosuratincola subterraneus]